MPSLSASIVVVGSANTDLVVRAPSLPRPGETVIGGPFMSIGGGKGANQAVAAARAGGNTTFIAKVGADAMGDAAVAAFAAERIDTTFVTRDPATPSGVAFIVVDDRGENSIVVAPGANDRLLPADIDRAADVIRAADILLVQLEIPLETVRHAVAIAHDAGVPVILNPAPARPLDHGLLTQVAIITPNETEAELLVGLIVTDDRSAASAAPRLLTVGPRSAVITLGRHGALVAEAATTVHVAGHSVTPVDTVAAGDVFNGCLAVAFAEGKGLTEAARFANAAAALSVTRRGAQASAPRRDEIVAFQSSQQGFVP